MNFLKDPRRHQELNMIIGLAVFLIVPFWVWGLKDDGIVNLCSQYIVISTALMAIIFAAMAIRNDENTQKNLKFPLLISSLSLFTAIYTYFLAYLNSSTSFIISVFFSIATILLFTTILEINMVSAVVLGVFKHPN